MPSGRPPQCDLAQPWPQARTDTRVNPVGVGSVPRTIRVGSRVLKARPSAPDEHLTLAAIAQISEPAVDPCPARLKLGEGPAGGREITGQ